MGLHSYPQLLQSLISQALAVIEYLVAHGSERAVDDIIEHTFQISVRTLRFCIAHTVFYSGRFSHFVFLYLYSHSQVLNMLSQVGRIWE